MRYLGGKARLSKKIVPILMRLRKPNQVFVEPFLGGCNILPMMANPRIAGDVNKSVALMWKGLAEGTFTPPTHVTPEEHAQAKYLEDCALKGYIGIACSFNGIWFGGYARTAKSTTGQNYQKNGYDSAMKTAPLIKGAEIYPLPYDELPIPSNSLIYCDPPYNGVSGYNGEKFDSELFWDWCREKQSKGHTVVVSEYNAPNDFEVLDEFTSAITTGTNTGSKPKRQEFLWVRKHSDGQ